MKVVFKKYKAPLIGCGILLAIVALLSIINFNNLKRDIDEDKAKLEAASEDNIIENNQTKKDNQTEKKNKIEGNETIEVQDEENKNTDEKKKDTNNVKDSVNKKDSDTYALKNDSIKTKEKAKPAQTKETSSNSSTGITGGKYTVKKGDTLFLIAQKANVSVDHMMKLNNLNSDIIYENQVLKIKGPVSSSSSRVVSRGNERNNEDLYWLSRIIHSEAQGESYKGKVAVGNVILNRVNNSSFPNTVKGVVFDKQDGYIQFSPVIDGTIYNTPDAESVRAAREVLNGARPVGNALYFLNPRKSTNFWIVNNRRHMTTIGLHNFYY